MQVRVLRKLSRSLGDLGTKGTGVLDRLGLMGRGGEGGWGMFGVRMGSVLQPLLNPFAFPASRPHGVIKKGVETPIRLKQGVLICSSITLGPDADDYLEGPQEPLGQRTWALKLAIGSVGTSICLNCSLGTDVELDPK